MIDKGRLSNSIKVKDHSPFTVKAILRDLLALVLEIALALVMLGGPFTEDHHLLVLWPVILAFGALIFLTTVTLILRLYLWKKHN